MITEANIVININHFDIFYVRIIYFFLNNVYATAVVSFPLN